MFKHQAIQGGADLGEASGDDGAPGIGRIRRDADGVPTARWLREGTDAHVRRAGLCQARLSQRGAWADWRVLSCGFGFTLGAGACIPIGFRAIVQRAAAAPGGEWPSANRLVPAWTGHGRKGGLGAAHQLGLGADEEGAGQVDHGELR